MRPREDRGYQAGPVLKVKGYVKEGKSGLEVNVGRAEV